MAIITGDRHSRVLFPPSLEELVGRNDPVRVYDAFVNTLDMKALDLCVSEKEVGAPCYDPVSMLKLLVYGYSYGFRSSRKLERACHHNISFIWLLGGLKPDHKTISEFRRRYRTQLRDVLRQCARLCMKFGMIEGNTLFLDGSLMRANASVEKFWTKEKCEEYLRKVDKNINILLDECESQDKAEAGDFSLVKLKEELNSQEALRDKVTSILSEIEEKDLKRLNSTDGECVIVRGRQGTHAGYNAQLVTDDKNGLIVSSDALSRSNDTSQFSNQIIQAEEVLEKECETACSDSGYSQLADLSQIVERGTNVIVPNQKQAGKKDVGDFDKSKFKYDSDKDEYICPTGHRLTFWQISRKKGTREYKMKPCSLCLNCRHYGVCTTAKRGRTITRLSAEKEALQLSLSVKYAGEEGQAVYKRRKTRAELPFGYIKRVVGSGYFLLRGREGANAELALLSNGFNLKRMMNLIGISSLLGILGA